MKVPKPPADDQADDRSVCGCRRTRTPAEAGLAYEDVEFTASDGLDLKGWFVPARSRDRTRSGGVLRARLDVEPDGQRRPVGCPSWTPTSTSCRPSRRCTTPASTCCSSTSRNHGVSATRLPITFGQWEARDMIGAVAYLRTRDDVDGERIGVDRHVDGRQHRPLGRAVLPAASRRSCAVQPNRAGDFTARFAADQLGKVGPAMVKPMDLDVRRRAGPPPQQGRPRHPRPATHRHHGQVRPGHRRPLGQHGERPGHGRRLPPHPPPGQVPLDRTVQGYRYISEQTEDVAAFFQEYL